MIIKRTERYLGEIVLGQTLVAGHQHLLLLVEPLHLWQLTDEGVEFVFFIQYFLPNKKMKYSIPVPGTGTVPAEYTVVISVEDPHWFQCARIRIQLLTSM